MTEPRQKPQTPSEIQKDIADHPERGKIGEEEVLALDRRLIRGAISGESKRKLLRVMAVYGLDMSEGLALAINALWRQERSSVEAHEKEKSDRFGVSVQEIQGKSYGVYKAKSRARKSNLEYRPGEE